MFPSQEVLFHERQKALTQFSSKGTEKCAVRGLHLPLFIDFQLLPSEYLQPKTKCGINRIKVLFTPSVVILRTIVESQPTFLTHSLLDSLLCFFLMFNVFMCRFLMTAGCKANCTSGKIKLHSRFIKPQLRNVLFYSNHCDTSSLISTPLHLAPGFWNNLASEIREQTPLLKHKKY